MAKIQTWQGAEGTGRTLQGMGTWNFGEQWTSSATQQSITCTQEPKLGNSATGWKRSANCASFWICRRPRKYALESEVKNQVLIRWPLQNNNARQDGIIVICIIALKIIELSEIQLDRPLSMIIIIPAKKNVPHVMQYFSSRCWGLFLGKWDFRSPWDAKENILNGDF